MSTDRMSIVAVEADRGRGWIADRLLIDFGFYEPCQVSQRLLPAEITGLERDGRRQPLLDDIDLRADAPRSRANELFLGDSAQDDPQILPLPPLSRLLSKLPWPCLPEINYSITSDPANTRKRRWVSTKFIFRAYQNAVSRIASL